MVGHRTERAPARPVAHGVGLVTGLAPVLLALAALPVIPVAAQSPAGPPPVDTSGLAHGPFSTMEMLYERTIFNVDVLTLTLRFADETAAELERLAEGRSPSDALADSLARTALEAQDVLVKSRFERGVSLEQFLGGLRDGLDRAREAGLITGEAHRTILADVSVQYEPLADRGIEEGEIMWYRIRGDSLHVAFQALDGSVPVEERPVGPERRMGVLGGYLAPGSDFREKLIRSLFSASPDAPPPPPRRR